MINGVAVIVSEYATEAFRIFPDKKRTKRRLRRLRGKYGSEWRRRPAAFQTAAGLIVHPQIYAALRNKIGRKGL